MILDLSQRQWTIQGWRPLVWQTRRSMELGSHAVPEIGPVTATVPTSVQATLLNAGLVRDWNIGMQSRECQWVEHYHWEFTTVIAPGVCPAGEQVWLEADGLDYSGWILIDAKIVATFCGALLRHRFDLTPLLSDGRQHHFSIVFDAPPEEQGQFGFTSLTRHLKPRYAYSWDWCPRFVPIGVWEGLRLAVVPADARVLSAKAELAEDMRTGEVRVRVVSDGAPGVLARADICGTDGRVMASTSSELTSGENVLSLRAEGVQPWWPSGQGDQPLYQVNVTFEHNGQPLRVDRRRVGFKRVKWLPCEGAPADAIPWICEINGRAIFLQGVNWTPVLADYQTPASERYKRLVNLYRAMGCNILRVWGGAGIESALFYDLCDEAGLLVWQEFPLSSSGIDNWPPEDPATIASLSAVARDYIRRHAHHACKLMWCGGNELQSAGALSKTGVGVPVDLSHPCIAALARVVEEEDPGTRFVPTSASGPRFMADAKDFGKGLHHDVHGPWGPSGTLEEWRVYWDMDDALFRSEVGAPGASPADLIERHCGDCDPWPPNYENSYWRHGSVWWVQWDRFAKDLLHLPAAERYHRFTNLSQTFQSAALEIAAQGCRQRFPRCGGIIIWMGHDCFPCPANTAIIDFELRPKPAYYALARAFGAELREER